MDQGLTLGVDVGWSEANHSTGACLFHWDAQSIEVRSLHLPTARSKREELLKKEIEGRRVSCVGIDGPLRPGLDEIKEYRQAELLLTRRFGSRGIGKPGQSSSANGVMLNRHANEIALGLVSLGVLEKSYHPESIHDLGIVEAFPTTFLGVMLDEGKVPSSKAKSDVFFEHLAGPEGPKRLTPDTDRLTGLLLRLLPGRSVDPEGISRVTDHELRAAVICALTALCVSRGQYVAAGDRRNGYIILPPRSRSGEPGLQPWAWTVLGTNLTDATADYLRSDSPEPNRKPEVIARTGTPTAVASGQPRNAENPWPH